MHSLEEHRAGAAITRPCRKRCCWNNYYWKNRRKRKNLKKLLKIQVVKCVVKTDLPEVDQCRNAVSVAKQIGKLDILVNAAGITDRGNMLTRQRSF